MLTPENTKLRNIASGVIIPDSAADDIINYPDKGQARYEKFIEERLKEGSPLSVWDRIPQLKLKRFSTWAKAKKVKVGNKVMYMKEDRGLYSRIIKLLKIVFKNTDTSLSFYYLITSKLQGKYEMSMWIQ